MPAERRSKRDLSLTPSSEEELGELADITPGDAARAELEWRKVAPKPFDNILQAEEE